MSILDKLNHLNDTKDLIRQAIIAKGIAVAESDTFRSYASKIASISSGGGGSEITGAIPKTIKLGEDCEAGDIVYAILKNVTDPTAMNTPVRTNDISGTKLTPYEAPYASNGMTAIGISGDGNFIAGSSTSSQPYTHTYKWNETNNRYEETAYPYPLSYERGHQYAFSYDGTYMAIFWYQSPYVMTYKWNETNNRYEKTTVPDTLPTDMVTWGKLSLDGSKMVVHSKATPYLWSYKWSESNQRYEKTANPNDTSFEYAYSYFTSYNLGALCAAGSSDLSILFSGSYPNRRYAWKWVEANNRYERCAVACPSWTLNANAAQGLRAVMSGDGSKVVLVIERNGAGVLVWDQTNEYFKPISEYEYGFRPSASGGGYIAPSSNSAGFDLDMSANGLYVVSTTGQHAPFFRVHAYNETTGLFESTKYPDIQPDRPVSRVSISDDGGKIVTVSSAAGPTGLYVYTYKNVEEPNFAAYKQSGYTNKPFPSNCYAVGFLNESGSKGDSVSMSCLWIKQDVFA